MTFDVRITPEFFYSRGRSDVFAVAEDDSLIVFEAKLTAWKLALHQDAYRHQLVEHLLHNVLS